MLLVFGLAALVQVLIWRFVFAQALPAYPTAAPVSPLPVSVIVCFHNEEAKLERCLRGILTQQHPDFEVIAVDDNSIDGSAILVTRLTETYPNLRLLRPGATRPGKKDALTAGIAAAHHEALLLTDADCAPASPHWLSLMTAPLSAGYEVVLGASPYRYAPGLRAGWQRFETTYTALQYLGFARLGLPYMAVGRNLAYQKSFFERAGGLASHAHLPGGDDDLLINAHALAHATACVTAPAAWTYSAPTPTWRAYLRQKRRHQSAGTHYRPAHQLLLGVIALSHGLFFLAGFLLLFTPYWSWVIYFYVVRAAAVQDVLLSYSSTRFLGGAAGAMPSNPVWFLPFTDLLLAPYYLFLAVATALPTTRW